MPNIVENRLTYKNDAHGLVPCTLGKPSQVIDFRVMCPTGPLPSSLERRNLWGSSYNAGNIRRIAAQTYCFTTGWSPPNTWLKTCSVALPGVVWRLEFASEDEDVGVLIAKAGEVTEYQPDDPAFFSRVMHGFAPLVCTAADADERWASVVEEVA